jgi:hypothetical protein
MHKFTVADPAGHSVGSGEIVGLSTEQIATRGHRVEPVGQGKDGVTPVRVLEPLQFKTGEVIYLDRALKGDASTPATAKAPPTSKAKAQKAEKRDVNGDTPEMAEMRKGFQAELDNRYQAGRAAMLEEIKARNAVIEAAEAASDAVAQAKSALDKEQDPAKRVELQRALDVALEAEDAANKAVEGLPKLEG